MIDDWYTSRKKRLVVSIAGLILLSPATFPDVPAVPDVMAFFNTEASFGIREYLANPNEPLAYATHRHSLEVATGYSVCQSSSGILYPFHKHFAVPLQLSVTGYERYFAGGLLFHSSRFALGVYGGVHDWWNRFDDEYNVHYTLVSSIEENRWVRSIVSHVHYDITDDEDNGAGSSVFYADVRFHDILLRDHSYDATRAFLYTGNYIGHVRTTVYGVRFGSEQRMIGVGYQSFSRPSHVDLDYDDGIFFLTKVRAHDIAVYLTIGSFDPPVVSVWSEGLFGIEGVFSIGIDHENWSPDSGTVFRVSYSPTSTIENASRSIRSRRALRGAAIPQYRQHY